MEENSNIVEECLSYKKYVYNFIFKMTCNEMLSEEILQETFLRVIKNLDQFKGRSELKTWIIAIAKNEVFKYIKNQKKNLKALNEIRKIENAKPLETEFNRSEYLDCIDQIKNGCLFALLNCLPFNQRCAFILHILNDIPINTVSKVFGKTANAARILICRAKSTIKNFLCDNCEYISDNPKCRCQNMLNFSIKNKLIREIKSDQRVAMAKIELRKFKNEIDLVKSLPDKEITEINFDAPHYKNIFKKK